MIKLSLDSESLVVDWVSFNFQGLVDSKIIANRLSKYFILYVLFFKPLLVFSRPKLKKM
jgi:hypothetical protein